MDSRTDGRPKSLPEQRVAVCRTADMVVHDIVSENSRARNRMRESRSSGSGGAGGNLLAYPADHVGSSPVYPRKLTTFCTAQVESDQERTSGRAPMLPNLHERGSACSTTPPDADPRQRGARSRSFSAL